MSPHAILPASKPRRHAAALPVAACALFAGLLSTASAADAPPSTALQAGPLAITFGGFLAFETVDRNVNETTDIGSYYGKQIPFPYLAANHVDEFRETARQSRLTMLVQGPHDGGQSAEGYFELDFLGAAPTANSTESNSYQPRIRNIYGLYRDTDNGFYILAGQNWSLATLYKQGLNPRQENVPQTIDAQYVTGFNWTRNPQLRIVKTVGDMAAIGISFESPQAIIDNSGNVSATTSLTGAGQFSSTNSYTLDVAPDIIAKAAFDPGYGHYEVYVMARAFRDRAANASGVIENNTSWGTSIGGGLILPLAKQLDFQVSALAGDGIGRYGSAQLPDVTIKPDGTVATIGAIHVMAGFVFRPTPTITTYLYGGEEKANLTAFTNAAGTVGYGYGSPLYTNGGCNSLTGTASTCVGDTRKVEQAALGVWWKYYQSALGNLQLGLEASHVMRYAFWGLPNAQPSVGMNVYNLSMRYYPYQK